MSERPAIYHVARDYADEAVYDADQGVPLTDAQLAWLDRVGVAGPDPYDRSLSIWCQGKPLLDRLADKFLIGDDCWPWVGGKADGYGSISTGKSQQRAHCVLYELLVGEIPQGRELHHTCDNRGCVNPSHLVPLTRREHIAVTTNGIANRYAATACKRGHEYTPANTDTSEGWRRCRVCNRERMRRSRKIDRRYGR